jgi:hypothetical protein
LFSNFGARQNQQAALLLDGFQGSWKNFFFKLFLLAFFHIYMKKDLEAKPDLPYIYAANRALIYIFAFPLPHPPK